MVPLEQIGGAMVIIITIGISSSLFAPILVLYPEPVPFLAMATFMMISFVLTCFLPIGVKQDANIESIKDPMESLIYRYEEEWNEE